MHIARIQHPAQPQINRLIALSERATRLRHMGWAANLEAEAIRIKQNARHEMWMAEQKKRRFG